MSREKLSHKNMVSWSQSLTIVTQIIPITDSDYGSGLQIQITDPDNGSR